MFNYPVPLALKEGLGERSYFKNAYFIIMKLFSATPIYSSAQEKHAIAQLILAIAQVKHAIAQVKLAIAQLKNTFA